MILLVLVVATPGRADFNEIITGARPAGMGGAFVALADDVNALYWNPAGLTLSKQMQIGAMHASEMEPTLGPSVATDFGGWSSGNSGYGAVGIAALRQGLSDIIQERTLGISYGLAVNPFARFGLTLKSMATTTNPQGKYAPDPALVDTATIGVDFGGIYVITPDLRFGFLARNFFAKSGVVEQSDVTKTYRLGAAFKYRTELIDEDYIWFTLDLFTKQDINDQGGTKIRNAIGAEWQLTPWIAVRAGADRGRWTAGAGLTAMGLAIDYAYEQGQDAVGNSQRLSLTYRFGGEIHVDRQVTHVRHRPEPEYKAPQAFEPRPRTTETPTRRRRDPEG
jgi:hypothetical protein